MMRTSQCKAAGGPRRLAVLLILIGMAAPAAADGISDLLPGDPVVVVRATGLAEAWDALKASNAADRLERLAPPGLAGELQNARTGIAQFEEMFTLSVERTILDIFGKDCAVALYLGREEPLELEGVFVAQGESDISIISATNSWLNTERALGKVADENTLDRNGVQVHLTSLVDPNDADAAPVERYHCFVGNLLIVSRSLDLLAKVAANAKADAPAGGPEELAEALAIMPKDALVRAYADVDRFAKSVDLRELLDGKLQNPAVRTIVGRISNVLPLIKHIAFSLAAIEGGIQVRESIIYDEAAVSPELRALLPPEDAPLSVLQLAPANAVVAAGHQVNKKAVWNLAVSILEEANPGISKQIEARTRGAAAVLGAPDLAGVLEQVGDQVGVFVTPAEGDGSVPALTIAVEMNNAITIPTAVRSLAGAAVLAESQKPNPKVTLEHLTYKGVACSVFRINEPELAGKLAPTFGVMDNWMILSTNTAGACSVIDQARTLAAPFELPGEPGTLMALGKLDSTRLAKMVLRFKDFLIREDVKKGKTPQKAEEDWDNLVFLLGFIDSAVFYTTHLPGRIDRVGTIKCASE